MRNVATHGVFVNQTVIVVKHHRHHAARSNLRQQILQRRFGLR
ncbi:Uncharacterised protein [Vibrio cholerae]|nr:Uncharacterised protein [Vibrio cholerae]